MFLRISLLYRYIYLIELFKDFSWDYRKIVRQSPFGVKDILFNSIWQRANEALAALLHTYGKQEEAKKYQQWAEEIRKALTNTWDQVSKTSKPSNRQDHSNDQR